MEQSKSKNRPQTKGRIGLIGNSNNKELITQLVLHQEGEVLDPQDLGEDLNRDDLFRRIRFKILKEVRISKDQEAPLQIGKSPKF